MKENKKLLSRIQRQRKSFRAIYWTPDSSFEKEPEPQASDVVGRVAEVVIDNAKSLSDSAEKISKSTAIVAEISNAIQKDLNKPIPVAVEKPKKRKWKWTSVRDYDYNIEHTIIEEE